MGRQERVVGQPSTFLPSMTRIAGAKSPSRAKVSKQLDLISGEYRKEGLAGAMGCSRQESSAVPPSAVQ